MNKFLSVNTPAMKLARTIFQAVIGVVVAYIDTIIGFFAIPDEVRPIIVGLVMAVLSPIMAVLGGEEKS